MTPEWVTLAVLSRVWGRRGELTAVSMTGRPERLRDLHNVFLFRAASPDEPFPAEVESVWEHRGLSVFKFRDIDSISDAEPLQGAEVRVPASERAQAPPDEFYHSDLVGCEVVERGTGKVLGAVSRIDEYGGPGILTVEGPEGELLVPFARSICVEIDVAARRIVVVLPEGLKEL